MINPRPIESAILICALFCLPRIVIPGRPVPDTPQIMVRIPAEGLSTEQVRSSMQAIVEEELHTLPEQIHLETLAAHAELLLVVNFPRGTPLLVCIRRIQHIMNRVQNKLPYQAARPIISPLPSEPPFLKLACSLSPLSEANRNLELAQLQEQLQRNPHIQRVIVHGYSPRRIVIRLDPEKLSRLQISPLYIQQYLQQSLFHFYSGVRPEGRREVGVEMQSSITNMADLKQLSLPLPRSTGLGSPIIHLHELAKIEWQNLGPSHFIDASGFPHTGLHYPHKTSTARKGEKREREPEGAGIFIHTSHHLQLFQQLMLFRFIRRAVGGTDTVEEITFSGGSYFSVIESVMLLFSLFAAGLLLCASTSSSFASHCNGTIWLYMLSWALVLARYTVFQIPLSPSRCIGIFIAVPAISALLAAANLPWMKQATGLCATTLAAATVIIGLGIALHGIVDGAVQQELRNSLPFHSTLPSPRPGGALFSPVTLSYSQVLQELCSFLSWGMLLSGLHRTVQPRRALVAAPLRLMPLNNLIAPCVLTALFAALLLILPSPHSYSLQTTRHPQAACLALSSHFRSRFPTASFSAGVPQYSQAERCSTAAEYWELRAHPQQISVDCLVSPLAALRGIGGLTGLGNLNCPEGSQKEGANIPQSTKTRRFSLKIKQKDSAFSTASRRELYSHLRLSVTGITIGSLKDTRSVSARVPVHLFYGSNSTLNEPAALPIFIDSSCVRLGELCEITLITESEVE